MKLSVCGYCGTEYDASQHQCPLCGSAAGSGRHHGDAAHTRGYRGKKRKDRETAPVGGIHWGWKLASAVLGTAVLAGLLIFLITMGYLGRKTPAAAEPVVSLPAEEQVMQESVPEPEQIPEDLSCQALLLSQTSVELLEKGQRFVLKAETVPQECPDPISFVSGDETVASVDPSGTVTANTPGIVQIYVSCGNITESCVVVCYFEEEVAPDFEEPAPEAPNVPEEKPEEMIQPTLSSVDFSLFRPGEEAKLSVIDAPDGAVITYSSDNSGVAAVTADGTVKAVTSGTATITVMVNDLKLTCVVRCKLEQTAENPEGAGQVNVEPLTPQAGRVIVFGGQLNIRQLPTTESPVLAHAENNDRLTVIGKSGDWYQVRCNGVEGFVKSDYVSFG